MTLAGYRSQSSLGLCMACPPTKAVGVVLSVFLMLCVIAAALVTYWIVLWADRGQSMPV